MKSKIIFVATTLLCLLYSGCGVKIGEDGKSISDFIKGSVPPFAGFISNHSKFSLIHSSHASVCGPDVFVNVHTINQDGTIDFDNSLFSTKLNVDTTFSIPKSVFPDLGNTKVGYVLRVSGCEDRILLRPLTSNLETFEDDLLSSQDITYSSTLVASSHSANVARKINQLTKQEVELLISKIGLNTTSELGAYNSLSTNTSIKESFQNTFGSQPEVLLEAAPKLDLVIPSSFSELHASSLRAITHHWNPNYEIAYVWKLNGQTKSTSANWSYIPDANSQGTHQVSVYVGKKDQSGNFDLSKPFSTNTFSISIRNSAPATPPKISLNTTNYPSALTGHRDIQFEIETGVGLTNCESFNYLAITESATRPASPNLFTIECNTDFIQSEDFTLSNSDGNKTLHVWAIDSSGNISTASETLTIKLDTTPPAINLTSLPTLLKGGQTTTSTWTISDLSPIVDKEVYYSLDGNPFQLITDNPTGNAHSWNVPAVNSNNLRIKVIANDLAGNTGEATSGAITVDSIAPTIAINSPANNSIHRNTLVLSGDCETGGKNVVVYGDIENEVNVACSLDSFLSSIVLDGSDGNKTVSISQEDQAGNKSIVSRTFVKDTTPPLLTQTIAKRTFQNKVLSNANTVQFGGACETGQNISIHGQANTAVSCNAGTWSYTTPSTVVDGEYIFNFTQEDTIGNSITISETWARNSQGPVLSNLTLANDVENITNSIINVALTLSDPNGVSKVCLKYNNTTRPDSSDYCWIDIALAPLSLEYAATVTIPNLNFQIGTGAGVYQVTSWGMDTIGNITKLEDSISKSVTYTPGTPPKVRGLLAVNTESPSNPLLVQEKTFQYHVSNISQRDDIYIKWNVYDQEGLDDLPISLYYTTDDNVLIPIVEDIANDQSSSCIADHEDSTIDDGFTGCYLWSNGTPTASYFRILLKVKDSHGVTNTAFSNESNSTRLQILAGNTSTGIGGPASTAVLYHNSTSTRADFRSFVVSNNGDIYVRDAVRGILKISQETGTVNTLIPLNTGVAINDWGDGVEVDQATTKRPSAIVATYDNQILLLDSGYIRRIDLNANPATIHNMIGGGNTNLEGGDPLDERIIALDMAPATDKDYPFFALPNGDIIFMSYNYPTDSATTNTLEKIRIRRYKKEDGKIYNHLLDTSGTSSINPAHNLGKCTLRAFALSFSPQTSELNGGTMAVLARTDTTGCVGTSNVQGNFMFIDNNLKIQPTPAITNAMGHASFNMFVTGLDGNIYRLVRDTGTIQKYNTQTGALVNIAGNGSQGECTDGTDVLQCSMAPVDIFVNSQGRIYIYEGRRIRFIDQDKKLVTLAGTSFSHGDDGPPLLARFGSIGYIDKTNAGEYVLLDNEAFRLRSFYLNGTIKTIAGNGNNTNGIENVNATSQGIYVRDHDTNTGFGLDKATGEVYYSYHRNRLGRLNRTTNQWEKIVGGGANSWILQSTDNTVGSQINLSPVRSLGVYGFYENHVIGGTYEWSDTGATFSLMKRWSKTNGTQSHFIGRYGAATNAQLNIDSCPTDSNLTACYLHKVQQNSYGSSYTKIAFDPHRSLYVFSRVGSSSLYEVSLQNNQFKRRNNLPRSVRGFTMFINDTKTVDFYYYCGEDGKLYQRNNNIPQERLLNFGVSTIECTGESLIYDEAKHSLVFAFRQNRLFGVAEYLLD